MIENEKMNPEIKAKWIAALRSGEYQQTHGVLEQVVKNSDRGAGFCCLGVLCKLAADEGVVVRHFDPDSTRPNAMYGAEEVGGFPPDEVNEWAGTNVSRYFVLAREDFKSSLADLNDNRGYTFEQVADVIEKEF